MYLPSVIGEESDIGFDSLSLAQSADYGSINYGCAPGDEEGLLSLCDDDSSDSALDSAEWPAAEVVDEEHAAARRGRGADDALAPGERQSGGGAPGCAKQSGGEREGQKGCEERKG